MKRLFFIVFLSLCAAESLFPQQSRTLFFMHDLPQASYVNPAIQPRCNLLIGFPVLNSIYANVTSTGFSYNDFSAGEAALDIKGIANNLHSIDYITTELHANLIAVGYKYNDFYFSFNIAEKVDLKAFYPNRIIDLAAFGNDHLVGKTMTTRGLGANANHYREYSLGVAQEVNENFSWGARAKLLFGKANLTTRSKPFSFTTEEESYNILADWAFQVNSSFPIIVTFNDANQVSGFDIEEISVMKYLLNSSNMGVGVDLGMVYWADPISFSASALDLGTIWWRSDAKQFNNAGAFVFEGIKDDDLNGFFDSVVDSLHNQVKAYMSEGSYLSLLSPKVNLGATYQFHPKFNAGVLFRTEFFPRRPMPSLTLSVNTVQLNNFMASLSYSVMNGSYNNIGVGLGFGTRNFVFHIISDNALAYILPFSAQTANLRFGMNLLFGCYDKEHKSKGKGKEAMGVQKKGKKKFKYSGPGCYTYRKEDEKK